MRSKKRLATMKRLKGDEKGLQALKEFIPKRQNERDMEMKGTIHSYNKKAEKALSALANNRDRKLNAKAKKDEALNSSTTMVDNLMDEHINEQADKIKGMIRKRVARKKLATLKSQPLNYINDTENVNEEAEKNKQMKGALKKLGFNKDKRQYQRARKEAGLPPSRARPGIVSRGNDKNDSWIEQMIEGEGPHLDSLAKAAKTPHLPSDYKPPARSKDDSEIRPPTPPSPGFGKVLSENLERAKAIYADILQGEPIATHLVELQKISPRKITANAGAKRVSEVIRDIELEASLEDITKRKGKRGKTSESRDAESVQQPSRPSRLPLRINTKAPVAPGKIELASPLGKSLQRNHRASSGAP